MSSISSFLLFLNVPKLLPMSSHHNSTLNFSHAPCKNNISFNNIDREIKMAEFRLRYVQLVRDAESILGDEDANFLIKESEAIWAKLNNSNKLEEQQILSKKLAFIQQANINLLNGIRIVA